MPAQITGNLLDALGFDLTVGDVVFYPGATSDQDVRVEPDGDVRLGWWSLAIADLPDPYQVPAGPMRIVLTPRGHKALGGTQMEPIFRVRTIAHQFTEGQSISWGQLLAGAVSAPLTPSQYDELVAMIEAGSGSYDDTALTGRVKALEDEPDPTWDSLAGKPAVIGAGTSATAARTAIGAGTSSLQLGTGSTTAKAGDWTPARADLDTSTRDSLAKADAAVPSTRKIAGKALTADVTLAKADVGLGNVDNTADAAKPVSTATQAALDGKAATGHTHTIAQVTNLQAELDDAKSRLATAEAKSAGATYAIRETGTGWPARTTVGASATQTVIYFALAATSTTPTDFAAGVDFLAKPSA